MTLITVVRLLDPSASPQTGVADDDSGIIHICPTQTSRGGAQELYQVTFSGDWSGGNATLTPYLCNEPGDSPRRWVQIKKLKDDGTDAAITRTDDFNLVLDVPAGSLVKWILTGSGSPIPSVILDARGVIRGIG